MNPISLENSCEFLNRWNSYKLAWGDYRWHRRRIRFPNPLVVASNESCGQWRLRGLYLGHGGTTAGMGHVGRKNECHPHTNCHSRCRYCCRQIWGTISAMECRLWCRLCGGLGETNHHVASTILVAYVERSQCRGECGLYGTGASRTVTDLRHVGGATVGPQRRWQLRSNRRSTGKRKSKSITRKSKFHFPNDNTRLYNSLQ